MKIKPSELTDSMSIVSIKDRFGNAERFYDDGDGQLFVLRNSMGIQGFVRARSWEDAYSIAEDELFPSADEDAFEKDHEQMTDHERACWDEFYGYRPNGQGGPTPKEDKGIYQKDLNGEFLDGVTDEFVKELNIEIEIEKEEDEEED